MQSSSQQVLDINLLKTTSSNPPVMLTSHLRGISANVVVEMMLFNSLPRCRPVTRLVKYQIQYLAFFWYFFQPIPNDINNIKRLIQPLIFVFTTSWSLPMIGYSQWSWSGVHIYLHFLKFLTQMYIGTKYQIAFSLVPSDLYYLPKKRHISQLL